MCNNNNIVVITVISITHFCCFIYFFGLKRIGTIMEIEDIFNIIKVINNFIEICFNQ